MGKWEKLISRAVVVTLAAAILTGGKPPDNRSFASGIAETVTRNENSDVSGSMEWETEGFSTEAAEEELWQEERTDGNTGAGMQYPEDPDGAGNTTSEPAVLEAEAFTESLHPEIPDTSGTAARADQQEEPESENKPTDPANQDIGASDALHQENTVTEESAESALQEDPLITLDQGHGKPEKADPAENPGLLPVEELDLTESMASGDAGNVTADTGKTDIVEPMGETGTFPDTQTGESGVSPQDTGSEEHIPETSENLREHERPEEESEPVAESCWKSGEEEDPVMEDIAAEPEENNQKQETEADSEIMQEEDYPDESASEEDMTEDETEDSVEPAENTPRKMSLLGAVQDTNWQDDFTYSTDTRNGKRCIILNKYNGTDTELVIPASAVINGITYHTVMSHQYPIHKSMFENMPVRSISFEEGVSCAADSSFMFNGMLELESLDLTNLDMSGITNLRFFARNCRKVTYLDVSGIHFSEAEKTDRLLDGLQSLNTIRVPGDLPLPQPGGPEGYAFAAWNTSPDGSGTSYRMGDTTGLSEPVTLYARYVEADWSSDSMWLSNDEESESAVCINPERGVPHNTRAAKIPAEQYGMMTDENIRRVVTAFVLRERTQLPEDCRFDMVVKYLAGATSTEPRAENVDPNNSAAFRMSEVEFYQDVLRHVDEYGRKYQLYVYVNSTCWMQNLIGIGPKHSLMVTKQVTDAEKDPGRKFRIVVTLTMGGSPLSGPFEGVNSNGEVVTLTPDAPGTISFLLSAGESMKLIDLQENVSYHVEEDPESSFGYRAIISDNDGIIRDIGKSVTVENRPGTGNLAISKAVDTSFPDSPTSFLFRVSLEDGDGNPVAGSFNGRQIPAEGEGREETIIFNEEGFAEITLKDREFMWIYGIPCGVRYKVEEKVPDNCRAVCDAPEGIIQYGDTEVMFRNTFEQMDGKLKILKSDRATGAMLSGAVFGIYRDAACTQEEIQVTTGEDGSAEIVLPLGTEYYVKEITPPSGYRAGTKIYGPYSISASKPVVEVQVENYKPMIVPTGIHMDRLSCLHGMTLAFIMLILVSAGKKRRAME